MKKNILFPIETLSRDFDYKLILAAMCADKDSDVYVGQHDHIFQLSQFMKGGLYLGKNLMRRKQSGNWTSERHLLMKKNGFTVIHLDEEGAITFGQEEDWAVRFKNRIDLSKIDNDDTICTWGNFQTNLYLDATKLNEDTIINTGHPRFNLPEKKYRNFYKDEVNQIKSEYGKFFLVNTNFALFNNAFSLKDTFSGRHLHENIFQIWGSVGKRLIDFVGLVKEVSTIYPEYSVIIRPHPSEDISTYQEIFSKIDNVHVVRKGTVIPWLLASELLIHDGCTTALEAYFADIPIINYHPFDNPETNLYLPNTVGLKCCTQEEVLEGLNSILLKEKKLGFKQQEDLQALSLLKNFENQCDSFRNIAKIVQSEIAIVEDSKFKKISYRFFLILDKFRSILRNLVLPLFPEKKKQNLVYMSVFPGFNQDEVKNKLNNVKEILDKEVKCDFINSNLLKISSIR